MARPSKVDITRLPETDECIDHQQKGKIDGYGHRGNALLHRLVFEQEFGYLPEAVMHECDNPRCINPKHLVAGDWDKNNKDRAAKGRSAKAKPSIRKISVEQAEEIRTRYKPRSPGDKYDKVNGVSALARYYRVDPNVIYNISKRRTHFA